MMMPFPIRFKSIWRVFEIASVGKIKKGKKSTALPSGEVVYSDGAFVQLTEETGIYLVSNTGFYSEGF